MELNVKEFVDIYDILKEDSKTWYKKYLSNQKEFEIIKEEKIQSNERVGFLCSCFVG